VIEMPILVAYASKHGATWQIAERSAESLAAGRQAEAQPVWAAGDLAGYGAFVTGSRRQPRSSPGSRFLSTGAGWRVGHAPSPAS